MVFPEWKHRRLEDLARHYGISTVGAHRALADCRMNQQVFELMAQDYTTSIMTTYHKNAIVPYRTEISGAKIRSTERKRHDNNKSFISV